MRTLSKADVWKMTSLHVQHNETKINKNANYDK